MLVLFRKVGDRVLIGGNVSILVERVDGQKVTLLMESKGIAVKRYESGLRRDLPVSREVFIKVLAIVDSDTIRIGIEAPRHIKIDRAENPKGTQDEAFNSAVRGLVRVDDQVRGETVLVRRTRPRGFGSRFTDPCSGGGMGTQANHVPLDERGTTG